MFLPLESQQCFTRWKGQKRISLIDTKTGKLKLGEKVTKTLVFQKQNYEFPLWFAIVRCPELRTPHRKRI